MADGIVEARAEVVAVAPETPLGRCPAWPVLFSFPPQADHTLARLRSIGVGQTGGIFAPVRAVVSALILYMPESPVAVVGLSNFSAFAGPSSPAGATVDALRRRTQVRLPAPLSLRLNRLIDLAAHEHGQRCSRTAVVVSLMERAQRQQDERLWRERFATVLSEPAVFAVPQNDWENPELILRLIRPKPGPRPQR